MTNEQSPRTNEAAEPRGPYGTFVVIGALLVVVSLFVQIYILIATGFALSEVSLEPSTAAIDGRREEVSRFIVTAAFGPFAVAGMALAAIWAHKPADREADRGTRRPVGAYILIGLAVQLFVLFAMYAIGAMVTLNEQIASVEKTIAESDASLLTADQVEAAFDAEFERINDALGAAGRPYTLRPESCELADGRFGTRYYTDLTQPRPTLSATDVVDRLDTAWDAGFRIERHDPADSVDPEYILIAKPDPEFSKPFKFIRVVVVDSDSVIDVYMVSVCTVRP